MTPLRAFILYVATAAATAIAEDITTTRGEKFTNVTISRTEPDGIVIVSSTGIVKIPFTELNEDLRKRFGYDPRRAAAYSSESANRQRDLYEQTQAAKNKIAADDAVVSAKSAEEAKAASDRRAISGFVLDAHETSTGQNTDHNWETNWGSYDRTYSQDKRIVIAVHDVRRNSAVCTIDVYFVAKALVDGELYIYGHQPLRLTVNQGIEARTEIAAPALGSRVLNLEMLGEKYVAGGQIEGWIVTAKIAGQPFGSKASSGPLTGDTDRLIAEYEERMKREQKFQRK